MERKRKLPARAAARFEQAAKRRTSTPPVDGNTTRSATPALSTVGADDENQPPEQEPPPQRTRLPRSIHPGKPLPTVEQAQSDDLSGLDYQSVQESGVLSESLLRSRQKWINEGIFEKYWSKPSKRRGVAADDPKNPTKDSMVKLGQVLITVEPHMFEATMYGVRDPKPAATLPANRPVIMYGPSRGSMPPPPVAATPPPPKQKKKKQPSQSPARTPIPATVSLPATPDQKPAIPASTPNKQPPQPIPATPAPLQSHPPSPAPPQAATAPGVASQPPTPSSKPILQPPHIPQQTPPPVSALPQLQSGHPTQQDPARGPPTPAAAGASRSMPSPRNTETNLAPSGPLSTPRAPPVQPSPTVANVSLRGPSTSMSPAPAMAGQPPSVSLGGTRPPIAKANGPSPSPAPGTPRQPSAPQPGADSIIVTLAERASGDPQLRDMMKRVANGQAPKEELDRFQAIINQITAENKRNGAAQGPSADRLLVDGRTVRFFAEEVRIILDIVLRSNPKQTSTDLRPPVGSDPLVVLLVKTALDEARVREMVRRIAENRPQFSDATDLKAVLDRLKSQIARDQESERQRLQAAVPAPVAPAGGAAATTPSAGAATSGSQGGTSTGAQGGSGAAAKANGAPNGTLTAAGSSSRDQSSTPPVAVPKAAAQSHKETGQQALRSRGPPPAPKLLDVSAVVFEFSGGTGDRYLFPKFSIIEYIPMPHGPPEVVASFLIVRKGSTSEYGGDPDLDYYQPITIRLQISPLSNSQKLLEYFARVVAPVDEVSRYMDNIMNNMTRAEYVLLAMRLPRKELPAAGTTTADAGTANIKDEDDADSGSGDKMDVDRKPFDSSNGDDNYIVGHPQPLQGVLWTTTTAASSAASTPHQKSMKRAVDDDQQYQSFIAGLIPKEVEEEA